MAASRLAFDIPIIVIGVLALIVWVVAWRRGADAARNVTGHVRLVKRDRGPKWYAKYRLPDRRQVQKMLGPAWTERGRPPEGYYTPTALAGRRRATSASATAVVTRGT